MHLWHIDSWHFSWDSSKFNPTMISGHHQYQQNEQSPLILNQWTQKNGNMTYNIENLGHGLGQTQKCGRDKAVNWIPTLPFW